MGNESDIEYFERRVYEALGVPNKYRGKRILADLCPFKKALIPDDVTKMFDAMVLVEVENARRQLGKLIGEEREGMVAKERNGD